MDRPHDALPRGRERSPNRKAHSIHQKIPALSYHGSSDGRVYSSTFEKAFREHFGKVFSSEDIKKIVLAMFPKFNQGSIIPADHAEHDNPKHTGQCTTESRII